MWFPYIAVQFILEWVAASVAVMEGDGEQQNDRGRSWPSDEKHHNSLEDGINRRF